MRKFVLLGICLIAIIMISGCTGKPTYSASSDTQQKVSAPEATTVQTLAIYLAQGKSWDADPEVDGIQVTIEPKDVNDALVKTNGVISAKLWQSNYDDQYNKVKGELIQEWSNISVTENSYGIMGNDVRLEYKSGFNPAKMDMGWLEITLTTPDGKSFTAREDSVFLAGF